MEMFFLGMKKIKGKGLNGYSEGCEGLYMAQIKYHIP
jgi:hypothetical protein